MALNECRECQHEVSDSADFCPSCGASRPVKAALTDEPRVRLGVFDVALGNFFG